MLGQVSCPADGSGDGVSSSSPSPDASALSAAYRKLYRKIDQARTHADWWECMVAMQNIRYLEDPGR